MIPGPLGMGGAPLGNLFAPIEDDVAAGTLAAAWESGIRYFDTAPHYGAGLSELRMGAALRRHDRDAFILSTKVGRLLQPARTPDGGQGFAGELPFHRVYDYSAAGTIRSLEDSMARLGTSRIDVVFIHDVSEDHHGPAWRDRFGEAVDGAAPTLTTLRDRGDIAAWGFGLNLVEPCLEALERSRPDVLLVAGRYTLLDQSALRTLFPACTERGVRVVLGGPYNSGLLAGGATFDYAEAAPEIVARVQAMQAVCARHLVELKAAALQFCAAHPVVAAVIPGARDPAEIRDNARLMQTAIPPAFWQALRDAELLPADAPIPAS